MGHEVHEGGLVYEAGRNCGLIDFLNIPPSVLLNFPLFLFGAYRSVGSLWGSGVGCRYHGVDVGV